VSLPERPTTVVEGVCPLCDLPSSVTAYTDELEAWRHDKAVGGPKRHIQVAMPEMSPGDRETLMTGIHSACWDAMFKDVDE
jgi:hypothetical protein